MSSEYTVSFKEAMVQKMSGPGGVSACSLSVETGARNQRSPDGCGSMVP